jgi:hypothetical protein
LVVVPVSSEPSSKKQVKTAKSQPLKPAIPPSGNVKGYIRAELGKTVKVRIEGRDLKVPKAKVVAMRTVERGMRGENQATNRLIDIDGSNDEEQVVSLAEQQREDRLIMERFVERLRAQIRREEGL